MELGLDRRINSVAPERDMLVHRPKLVRNDESDRVLLSIHGALSESLLRLGEVYADRIRAERTENVSKNRYPDHADIQSLEILWPADRTFCVGHLPETVLSPGDLNNGFLLYDLENSLAWLARLHGIKGRMVRKHER